MTECWWSVGEGLMRENVGEDCRGTPADELPPRTAVETKVENGFCTPHVDEERSSFNIFSRGRRARRKLWKNECWLSSTSLLTARCGARLLSVQDCRRLSPSTTSAKKKKYFLRTGQTNYRQKYSSPKTLSQMFPIASPYAIAYSETKDAEELARVKEQTFDVVSRITGLPFNTYCHN